MHAGAHVKFLGLLNAAVKSREKIGLLSEYFARLLPCA